MSNSADRWLKNVSQSDLRRAQVEKSQTIVPTQQIAPVSQTAPVTETPQPLPVTPAVSQVGAISQIAPTQQIPAGFFKLTNEITDIILPTLDVYSQSALTQLLRLSWGFQKDECRVGLPTIAKRCNCSESQVRRAIRMLIQRGLIKQLSQDFSNPNQKQRGTVYKILIKQAPITQRAPVRQADPVTQIPNKELTTYKEQVIKQTRLTQPEIEQSAQMIADLISSQSHTWEQVENQFASGCGDDWKSVKKRAMNLIN